MIQSLKYLKQRLHDWAQQPDTKLTGNQRTLRWWFDLIGYCAQELRFDRATQMAAALTYHTLFSLLPMVVLTLILMASFVGEAERDRFKATVTDWLLKPLVIEQAAPGATRVQSASARAEFERARDAIDDSLQQVMNQLENVNLRSIGVVGVLIFIWAATALLTTIEKSFNTIYGVVKARPPYQRLPYYFTTIVLAPLVLVGGQLAQRWFLEIIASSEGTRFFAGIFVALSPVLTTWLVLWLMYVLLPNTRVHVRSAAAGSFIAALLWVTAISLMTIYVVKTAASTVYGALALLPLFLLWLFITWLIVLFGLELTYVLQAMKGRRFKHLAHKQHEDMVIDPAWMLPLATQIAGEFTRGRPATADVLAREMNLPQRAVQRMLDAMERAELIHRVNGDDSKMRGYTLARPSERIQAAAVLDVGQTMLPSQTPHPGDRAWEMVRKLEETRHKLAEGTTLADLAARDK